MGAQFCCSTPGRAVTHININPTAWDAVSRHLLPKPAAKEEAAFLFGRLQPASGDIDVVAYQLLSNRHFMAQELDYLELNEAARPALIKHAHDLTAGLIEIHSHPGKLLAAFSNFDFTGLRETVPHMRWRLRSQPYVALVVADDSFDALIWNRDVSNPSCIAGINTGASTLFPTNLSIRRWK
jgi:hypothetical protein